MNQEYVNAILAAWNEGDMDGLDQYVDINTVRKSSVYVSSSANNLAELKQVIANMRVSFPDTKVTIDDIFFQNDRSFSRWTFEGTNTGPGDFPPTGKVVKIEGCSFSRYQNGKLVEELVYFDAMDMLVQLGLVQKPSNAG